MMRFLSIAVILTLLIVGGIGWYFLSNGNGGVQYRTAPVERGTLVATVGATGTIQPEQVIDVGAQVNGRVERFGIDPRYRLTQDLAGVSAVLPLPSLAANIVLLSPTPPKVIDYNSPVEQGTILAQIDPTVFQSKVEKARADLLQAQAELSQLQAKQNQFDRDWVRVQSLSGTKAVSQADVDLARQNYESSVSSLDSGRAKIAQMQATLREAETDLGFTTIRSPVNGSVVIRRYTIGQTVVSNNTAPSLFLIAKDLTRLQVLASVIEADIGQVKSGQLVNFTVDAHPNQIFTGRVAEDMPRLDVSMTNNVVTYNVIVNVDNKDRRLLLYETANVSFIVGKKDDALLAPNAALRWRPKPGQVHPDHRAAFIRGPTQKRDTTGAGRLIGSESADRGAVWVQEGAYVRPIRVKTGLTDGIVTEILEGDLSAEMQLIVGEVRQDSGGGSGGSNPFVPNTFGGKKKE